MFAEIPAGLAAVSLQLQGGKHARPPVSRQGNKAGYSHVILDAFGLRPGQGADAYLWVEADEDVVALLRCYPNPEALRAVAAIIRGWADEEPRALWTRLRDERKARQESERAARYAVVQAANRLINVADDGTGALRNTGKGGTTFGGADFGDSAGEVAVRVEELAGWIVGQTWSVNGKGVEAGYRGPYDDTGTCRGATHDGMNKALTDRPAHWPHVIVSTSIPAPPPDAEGCVLYMDPDYVGTTGYKHTLPRADVVRIATAWAAAGAVVAVSESVAIPELTTLGWEAIDIAGERRGQKRTFAANAGEYLTLSRPPVHRPATQARLWAAP